MQKLKIVPREVVGKKVKSIRKLGLVPAALYGPKFASRNMAVEVIPFKKVFKEAGYSNLIEATVEGEGDEKLLLKEVQMNPVTDEVLHISFYVTDKNTEITSEVPVDLVGLAPAQDMGVGFVIQSLNEIHVRCLPANLPDHFEVDVTVLVNIGDTILVSDLKLPEGVELDSDMDPNTAIVSVVGAQKIEEEVVEVAPELDADGNPIVKPEGEEGAEGAAEGGEDKEEE